MQKKSHRTIVGPSQSKPLVEVLTNTKHCSRESKGTTTNKNLNKLLNKFKLLLTLLKVLAINKCGWRIDLSFRVRCGMILSCLFDFDPIP